MQLPQCLVKFIRGGEIEAARHRDVTDARTEHASLGDRWKRHRVANEVEGLTLVISRMFDGNLYPAAALSQQVFANLRIGLARHRVSINGQDAIAISQSGPCRWRLRKCRSDKRINVVTLAQVFKCGANTKILGTLLGTERRELNRIQIS